jgi:hypothetical protein
LPKPSVLSLRFICITRKNKKQERENDKE